MRQYFREVMCCWHIALGSLASCGLFGVALYLRMTGGETRWQACFALASAASYLLMTLMTAVVVARAVLAERIERVIVAFGVYIGSTGAGAAILCVVMALCMQG